MNTLRQTEMSVRLGWERTKYHKRAYRHTRFPKLTFLQKWADLGETVFLKTMKIFELRWELTVDATVPNRER